MGCIKLARPSTQGRPKIPHTTTRHQLLELLDFYFFGLIFVINSFEKLLFVPIENVESSGKDPQSEIQLHFPGNFSRLICNYAPIRCHELRKNNRIA